MVKKRIGEIRKIQGEEGVKHLGGAKLFKNFVIKNNLHHKNRSKNEEFAIKLSVMNFLDFPLHKNRYTVYVYPRYIQIYSIYPRRLPHVQEVVTHFI